MGVETRRPPLPAPTDTTSMDDTSPVATEVATNITTRTDKTSYTIPEDGSPIVISTHRKDSRMSSHGRQKSQTSLLIEYFEGSKSADGKSKGRPSVRVKVTPSSRKSSGTARANDAVQITSIGSDRKPSYTRRISLNNKSVETGAHTSTELSHSSESTVSGRPPVEIEVLNNGSDLSTASRGLLLAHNESNVSSMPPDSMLEGETTRVGAHDVVDEDTITKETYLAAPQRHRSRSTSRERITQKVMEKLGQSPAKHRKTVSHDETYESRERRRGKSHRDDEHLGGVDGSALSSNPVSSHRSYNSNVSQASRVTNNARLLEKVEDTIKRILLPEITAIRDDQRAERKLRTFDDKHSHDSSLERRVSKSSSSPNIRSKPKVVLNRDSEDPGTVLSRGDSEYKKSRRSSGERLSTRKSSAPRRSDGYEEEETTLRRRRSSKSGDVGKAAAAAVAGGALTAAALRHHDSEHDMHERRKRRSKSRSSRSRSTSIISGTEEAYTRKETIPPMPMASRINDSELTRTSLLSTDHDMTESTRTPVREVSRGSLNTGISPVSSRTAVRTPVGKELGMSHGNRSADSPRSVKGRTAALATAVGVGVGVAAYHNKHIDADGYGTGSPTRGAHSPAQSVSSLRMQYEDSLVPAGLRPHSAASKSSTERLHKKSALRSAGSSPVTRAVRSQDLSDEFVTPMEHNRLLVRENSATPSGEDVEEWFNRQHLENEQLRHSLDTAPNRASYQTNPYPEDERRFAASDLSSSELREDRDVHGLGANPDYVHTPLGVESAVASLVEPSTLSSAARPSSYVETGPRASYSDRMAEQLKARSKDDVPMYEGSTMSQTMPSTDRWAAVKKQAASLSNSTGRSNATNSPRQSPVRSLRDDSPVKVGASGLPVAEDPLPEIGHFDDTKSDVSTNPSMIKGPLGGDPTGQSTWPYSPSPRQAEPTSMDTASGYSKEAFLGAGLAGGAVAAAAATYAKQHPTVMEEEEEERSYDGTDDYDDDIIDRNTTPTQGSPLVHRDEGYVTDAGARTPKPERKYTRQDIAEYKLAMDRQDDPFTTAHIKNPRSISGDSHGISSPLYDSATGRGMENIQSKDIIALMDHLTVRDGKRDARDSEMVITLVRTAAEMRQNFEDMKRFIHEQDKMIMANADRGQEATVQKVLGGPRAQPTSSPRTPRTRSEEDIQTKRKGVLRRALKGLTGGKSSSDLAKIENMLMQVLDNVEELKHQGVAPRDKHDVYFNEDGMDSYEKLRAAPDSGYEPEGFAGTNSTPSQSGYLAGLPQRSEKQVFHSGYNGRPGSENRVSTVMEGDEDEDLQPHERNVLAHQFEHNERLLTPSRDFRPDATTSPTGLGSPTAHHHYSLPANEITPKAAERQAKHKSNTSSIFGVPKISRWSKTTTSSTVPESPTVANNTRPVSAASRSGSDLQQYDDEMYALKDDDRLRSTQSLARAQSKAETRSIRSQASRLTRTPSPLIPSEASYRSRDRGGYDQERGMSPVQHDDYDEQEFDDPKYKAIRNSILLQHPQPRQGSTSRHQTNLESKAHSYNDKSTTNSDLSQRTVSDFDPNTWGSAGVAALNKTRFNQAEPISPVSMGSPHTNKSKENTPLVPAARTQHQETHIDDEYDDESTEDEEEEEQWQPQYSNSGFARNANTWYSSPLGSGHLLEPIEEVRYSLETDSGRLSPEPQISSARAVTARKITGPRPMGSRNSSAVKPTELETSGTVRRKPVPGTRASRDTLDSRESESF